MFIKNIQFCRALAANAVLVNHLLAIEQKYGQGFAVLPFWANNGRLGVDLFFVISGFIMSSIAEGLSAKAFLLGRVTRIYPIYWIYTTIVLAASLCVPSIVNSSLAHPPSILRSYLLFPQDVEPLLAVGWTLVHEMYFYLCIAIILVLIKKTGASLLFFVGMWALVLVTGHQYGAHQSFSPITLILHPMTLEFMMGVCMGTLIRRGVVWPRSLLVLGVFLVGASLYLTEIFPLLADQKDWRHAATYGSACALIVYGAVGIELRKIYSAPKWLVSIGDASYSIYLSHVLVLSALGRMFCSLPFHSMVIEGLFVAFCVICANIVGLISYSTIELALQRRVRTAIQSVNSPLHR